MINRREYMREYMRFYRWYDKQYNNGTYAAWEREYYYNYYNMHRRRYLEYAKKNRIKHNKELGSRSTEMLTNIKDESELIMWINKELKRYKLNK